MTRPLTPRDSPLSRVANNQNRLGNEERKPVLGGSLIYVGTYVGPNDPGNDPPDTNSLSPPFQNGFGYASGFPISFNHGVDGLTDMAGMYDLITGSPVSGTVAFTMPLEWANQAEAMHAFPVRIEEGATVQDDIYVIAVQVIDTVTTGDVRIYWPTYAFPYTT